ncbi:MAG: DUF2063 domain-containing protein [Pseudomonadales bacterium]|nr:putative DNA-binding domain-containing protein [Gammaproteobacteria bacterium]NNL56257.1 DUF2063 domain-containing protein [Pseudomonadales bacterium]
MHSGANRDVASVSLQREFAAHLRDPKKNPAPANIEERRLNIYRELVYNNIESFISSGFPILRKLYADSDWHAMVRSFISCHSSATPYFSELASEFIDYLEHEHQPQPCDGPFLLELARYEWAELALFVAAGELPEAKALADDAGLLDCVPRLSPLAWPMVFNYAVHKIGPAYQPTAAEPEPVCLVVYRNRQQQVKFLQINTVTARLLELCEAKPLHSARQLLEQIVAEMQHPDPATVIQGGKEMLAQLHNLDIIL